MDRRAPPAGDRRGGTGDPLPPVTRMHHCRASVSGRAHGDRPDRAAGRPGDLRGGEDSAGQGLREPARGGDGREAARAREGGAGLGGPLREAGGHLSVRLHRDRGQQAGAPGRRVPPRVAITGASVYIRASSERGSQPMSRTLMAADKEVPQLSDERRKALNLAITQIEKTCGKGAIMRMGADSPRVRVEIIPTGAINLDAAIGIGGIPRGRVTEIFGPESSGKTTLALHVVANAQRQGGAAAYIDAEHALDVEYAKKLGVDIDNLLVSQPDTGEQGLEITEILVRSGAVDVVVVDSVAALVPKAEIEGDMGDSLPGRQARLMSQALRKLAGAINRSRTSVIFINQLREKIGIMFGNPETTTGGRALKFYASVRLDMRRIGPVKEREVVIGNHVRVKVVKNKVAPPFRQAEFDIMFDEGISHESLLVDIAAEAGIIEKSGAWYAYGKERIGQGRENAKLYLKDHPDLAVEVEAKVKEHLGVKPEMLLDLRF